MTKQHAASQLNVARWFEAQVTGALVSSSRETLVRCLKNKCVILNERPRAHVMIPLCIGCPHIYILTRVWGTAGATFLQSFKDFMTMLRTV